MLRLAFAAGHQPLDSIHPDRPGGAAAVLMFAGVTGLAVRIGMTQAWFTIDPVAGGAGIDDRDAELGGASPDVRRKQATEAATRSLLYSRQPRSRKKTCIRSDTHSDTRELTMARGKLIVLNEPASPEVEEEYNAWYDGDHLPQILANVPTITGAKRYRIAPGQHSAIPGAPRYLSIYDIEADIVMDAYAQLGQATKDGKVIMTEHIRSDPPSTFLVYEEI